MSYAELVRECSEAKQGRERSDTTPVRHSLISQITHVPEANDVPPRAALHSKKALTTDLPDPKSSEFEQLVTARIKASRPTHKEHISQGTKAQAGEVPSNKVSDQIWQQ
mgnify:CR=1 FL=1